MGTTVHPISLGSTQCFVLRGKSAILIDTGGPKNAGKFAKSLQRIGMNPRDIKLIVITHGHYDHIGSARDIQEMTGAKIAMHERDKENLEKGVARIPPGVTTWGRMLSRVLSAFAPLIRFPGSSVDIVLGDREFSLADYGIPGKVIPTPGHSSGSVSVLLASGEAFVGDMAMSGFPLRLSPGLPIFAENPDRLRESWKRLLKQDLKTIYPAHGKPLSPEVVQRALSRGDPCP
jgi:glyoxylase-like metal-dependent hydrolase (beta-lactamase superfamily II)